MNALAPDRWLFAGTATVALAFAAITGHAWEDYFITFRSSLNLATGHGLVFQPGERVHSFTSPLGTLFPALFALGGGDGVELRALWLYRVLSAGFLAGTVALLLRTFRSAQLLSLGSIVALAAFALDPKIVGFSMNGMETALLVFFIALAWHGFARSSTLACAAAFAGLQWTRPDGCVFFGVLGLGWLLFGDRISSPPNLGPKIVFILRTLGLGLLAYLPWIAVAWAYYGSPIPHTIAAKVSHHAPGELAFALLNYPWRLLIGHVALHDIYLPAYHFFGGWPDALRGFSRVITLGAALAWLWPRIKPAGRIASFAFFLGGFYVEYIPRSPWYYPGWQTLGLIAWAFLLDALAALRLTADASIARIAGLLLVGLQASLLLSVTVQMRAQQAIIEDGHRREIGRWLGTQARPSDTVFLECLGYIGYYSRLKMLDHPGLASPEVVAARRAGAKTYAQIITRLQPDWLVLRPWDAETVFNELAPLRSSYVLIRTFDARLPIAQTSVLPGRGYLEFDAVFLVYRRSSASEIKTSP